MKKLACIVLALCMVLCLAACGKSSTSGTTSATTAASGDTNATTAASSGETIKIGMYAPLTGNSSTMGTCQKNCAQLAVDQINAKGGLLGKQVELVCYDDQSSTETAVKVVTRLVEEDKVVGLVGSLHSGNIKATGAIVEQAKIPEIGTGLAKDWLQQGWTYLFRSVGNTECSNSTILDLCDQKGWKNIAVIYTQDDYGTDTNDVFVEYAKNYPDINIVADESFNPDDSDMTGQASKINAANPDAVFVIAIQNDSGSVIKQLRLAGYEGILLGDSSMGNTDVINVAGDATNNCIFSAQYVIPGSPDEETDANLKAFFEAYKSAYGEMPTSDTGLRAYDATSVLLKGIELAGSTDGTAIRDAIYTISGLDLLGGTFDYTDKTGEGIHVQRLYTFSNDKIVEYKD